MDETEQFSKQVSRVFPIMFAVRLVQHREQRDEYKIIKDFIASVSLSRGGSKELSQETIFCDLNIIYLFTIYCPQGLSNVKQLLL